MADDDNKARLIAVEQQIIKIRELLGELASVVWGDNVRRDNGLRSRVIVLESFRSEAEDESAKLSEKLRHYIDAERRETCFGLAELERRDSAEENEEVEETDVKVATIQAQGSVAGQRWAIIGMIVSAGIQAIGIVLVTILS